MIETSEQVVLDLDWTPDGFSLEEPTSWRASLGARGTFRAEIHAWVRGRYRWSVERWSVAEKQWLTVECAYADSLGEAQSRCDGVLCGLIDQLIDAAGPDGRVCSPDF